MCTLMSVPMLALKPHTAMNGARADPQAGLSCESHSTVS